MSKFDCIIYDFDGVVLDTVQLKIDAFCKVYQCEAPDKIEAVRSFAEANGGLSRFEKFRYFERSVFGRNDDPTALGALCAAYAQFVEKGVAEAGYIPGAPECFAAAGLVSQHIVSAAPEEDVLKALDQRCISHYFHTVSGAPKSKLAEFEKIISANEFDPLRVLAIGDSLAEYHAAVTLGIPFLAIVGAGIIDRFPAVLPRLPDLRGLVAFIS